MKSFNEIKNAFLKIIKTIYIYLINIDYKNKMILLKYKFYILKNNLKDIFQLGNKNIEEINSLNNKIDLLKNENIEKINFLNNKIDLLENENMLLIEGRRKSLINLENQKNILWGYYDLIFSISEKKIIELSDENSYILNCLGKSVVYINGLSENKISLKTFNDNIKSLNLIGLVTNETTIDEVIQLSKFLITTNDLMVSKTLINEYKITKNN
jgi:hypothetical protein